MRARREHVATEDQVGLAGGDALRLDVFGPACDPDMRGHGAVLLRHAGHVERRDAFALQMGRHAYQGTDCDDPGAADAGDQDVVGVLQRNALQVRADQTRQRVLDRVRATSSGRRLPPSRSSGRNPGCRSSPGCRTIGRSRACGRTRSRPARSTVQLDCTPQSPQPSHTASLMKTRCVGSGYSPFLRRRRFSAAQVWS